MTPRLNKGALLALAGGIALAVIALSTPAMAQAPATAPATSPPGPQTFDEPVPAVREMSQRSGIIFRQTPIESTLPPDPRRDRWYNTRWGDSPNERKHVNWYPNGGLYGLRWRTNHTRSIWPFFYGSPGESTMNADVHPVSPLARLPRAIFHPFKPIGMYYNQGSYVPIYDLDPIVPGPGPWPWPFFQKLTAAGG